MKVAACGNVRPHAAGARDAIDIRPRDFQGKSLLEGCYTGELPAANHFVGGPVGATGNLLAAAEGQLVDPASYNPLRHVEVRTAVVEPWSGVVFVALVSGLAGACSGGRRLVIHALGPGIDRGHGQVAGAMFELRVAGVVVRVTLKSAVDVGSVEVRIRQAAGNAARGNRKRADCIEVVALGILLLAKRQVRGRNIVWLGNIRTVEHVRSVGSNVVQFQGGVLGKLALDRQRPGLNVRVARILRLDNRDERQGILRERPQ